jgi:hypothetical protein
VALKPKVEVAVVPKLGAAAVVVAEGAAEVGAVVDPNETIPVPPTSFGPSKAAEVAVAPAPKLKGFTAAVEGGVAALVAGMAE